MFGGFDRTKNPMGIVPNKPPMELLDDVSLFNTLPKTTNSIVSWLKISETQTRPYLLHVEAAMSASGMDYFNLFPQMWELFDGHEIVSRA